MIESCQFQQTIINLMPVIQMTESCHFQPNVCWPHERITETSMNIYEPNARKPNDRIMPLWSNHFVDQMAIGQMTGSQELQ